MTTQVDRYFTDGCMRCKYGGSPLCKVNKWREILEALRALLHQTPLKEEAKWGVPCYTFEGKNVLILSAFKDFASLSFFKGSLMADPIAVLEAPGEHTQAGRYWKFYSLSQVEQQASFILDYLRSAIILEQSGQKVGLNKEPMPWPEELIEAFDGKPELKEAFLKLSPGRQRGYLISLGRVKQSATRKKHIQLYIPRILEGKGLQDH